VKGELYNSRVNKKILYLFSDTGGGHRSAATALIKAVNEISRNKYRQDMVDVFAECSGFLNIFARLYGPVIKYSPKMWGRLYYWLDDPKRLEMLERLSRPFILKELKKLIKERNPDLIVSVHPMVNHLTSRALKELRRKTPFLVVITDPVTLHRAWIAKDVDRYFVATEEAAKNCEHYGLQDKSIKVLGMPIDPKFAKRDFEKAKARFDDLLDPDYFTVMLMGGGEGAGGLFKIVRAIIKSGLEVQLIVVAGRNQRLEEKLRAEAEKAKYPLVVFGFTDKIAELMSESDLLITKAGPGSIAEALAMNLPMIITSWLPGQEEGNVEFVVREGLGRVSEDPSEVVNIIESLMHSPEFQKMKRNIQRVRKPTAALDIGREIIKWL